MMTKREVYMAWMKFWELQEIKYIVRFSCHDKPWRWYFYVMTCMKHEECTQEIKDFGRSVVLNCKRRSCPVKKEYPVGK